MICKFCQEEITSEDIVEENFTINGGEPCHSACLDKWVYEASLE